jgi:hypothetical protein
VRQYAAPRFPRKTFSPSWHFLRFKPVRENTA